MCEWLLCAVSNAHAAMGAPVRSDDGSPLDFDSEVLAQLELLVVSLRKQLQGLRLYLSGCGCFVPCLSEYEPLVAAKALLPLDSESIDRHKSRLRQRLREAADSVSYYIAMMSQSPEECGIITVW